MFRAFTDFKCVQTASPMADKLLRHLIQSSLRKRLAFDEGAVSNFLRPSTKGIRYPAFDMSDDTKTVCSYTCLFSHPSLSI